MALIVENGFYLDGANSYVSLENADKYLVPRNLWPETPLKKTEPPEDPDQPETPDEPDTPEPLADEPGEENPTEPGDPEDPPQSDPVPEYDEAAIAMKEAALMRAFDWLNSLKWKGRKHCWEMIPAWPRMNVPIPGVEPVEYIDPKTIPRAVIQSQCELAALIYNGNDLFAPVEHGGKVKSVQGSKYYVDEHNQTVWPKTLAALMRFGVRGSAANRIAISDENALLTDSDLQDQSHMRTPLCA